MNGFPAYLAKHYLWNMNEKNISTMTKISFLGIFTGTFALALVFAIMSGFEQETHKKLQGFHTAIIMHERFFQGLEYEKIAQIIHQEFPEIESFCPCSSSYVLIEDKHATISHMVAFKGIDPTAEKKTTTLDTMIVAFLEARDLEKLVYGNHILIGTKLANYLQVTIGDTITLLFPEDNQTISNKITLTKQPAIIAGIFKTGIEEFDSNLAIGHLQFMQQLFPQTEITQIGINPVYNVNQEILIKKLKQRFGLSIYSWQELYPSIISALILEKYASLLVLGLIILVSCLTIVSLLFMQITYKRPDIAILKSMGASFGQIRGLFLIMGMTIATIAAFTGTCAAYSVGWLLKYYIPINLPDAYYVSHLPVSLDINHFALAFGMVIFISFLATSYAVGTVKKINITKVLRFEA